MNLYSTNIRDLIEQLEEELVINYNECNEDDPDHKPAENVSDFRVYYHMEQRDWESDWDLYNELLRAREAAQACEGISTAQLRLMNAIAPASLTAAYDVCSQLREALSDNTELRTFYEDNPIEWGLEIGSVVLELSTTINNVVAWALKNADATDTLHPMETAS